jgi:hypothetical protein
LLDVTSRVGVHVLAFPYGERIKRLVSFLGEYFDLLLAMLAAIVVAILGLTGQVTVTHLAEATLAVLAALCAGLIRERWRRDRLGDSVRDVLAMTDVQAPWEALEAEHMWEILDDKGARAAASSRKVLRFLQTQTLTIYEFSGVPGTVSAHNCEGRWPRSAAWRDLPVMRDDYPGRQGKRYAIVSLEGAMGRGQMLEVRSTRELANTFPKDHEYVQVSVEVPTGEIDMTVIWPVDRSPKNVWVEQGSKPASEVPKSAVERLQDGRTRFMHKVPRPPVGDTITLSWDW